MPPSEISILLLGDADRPEFRQARSTLDACGFLAVVRQPEAAADALDRGQLAADVIVVAQAHPGQFSHPAIERLRRSAPSARLLALLGSWCEGETRSGRPWPGVIRTYWHQWAPRCDRQLGRICRGQESAWGLPATATDEERLLLGAEQPPATRPGLIGIYTRAFQVQDWLSAALQGRGCSTVWLRPPHPARLRGAAAVIFDASDCRGQELEQLTRLAAAAGPAPTIALLDFPRIEDRQRALAAGAAAVVSKPLELDDLFWELDRLARAPAP
jgi:CheY-like chemotaxis protein